MRPTLTLMLLALLLHACGPMRQMQKVESQIPMIGSIGKQHSKLFKKDFQKVGEPLLASPISVTVQSRHFSSNAMSKYVKYREHQGLQPLIIEKDTTTTNALIYFEMTIDDVVGLAEQLNQSENQTLSKYLQEDTDLVLLSQISFIADDQQMQKIKTSDNFYLITDPNGSLSLMAGEPNTALTLKISELEAFDFETANFCWKKDNRGRLEIAHILMDGNTCPGVTEANPKKLDRTPDYLKL